MGFRLDKILTPHLDSLNPSKLHNLQKTPAVFISPNDNKVVQISDFFGLLNIDFQMCVLTEVSSIFEKS